MREIELRGKGERDWGSNFIGYLKLLLLFLEQAGTMLGNLLKLKRMIDINGNNTIP